MRSRVRIGAIELTLAGAIALARVGAIELTLVGAILIRVGAIACRSMALARASYDRTDVRSRDRTDKR